MAKRARIWVVDDDRSLRWVLEQALRKENYATLGLSNAADALEQLHKEEPALVLSDLRMPGKDGVALLQALKKQRPELPVIIMTAYSNLEQAAAAFRHGALEFLAKPFDISELLRLVRKSVHAAPRRSARRPPAAAAPNVLLGNSQSMQEVFRAIGRAAATDLNVLITGETGTGKELVAQALHRHSNRAEQPLVAVNAAAIPSELLETELFGHEKGAFTGALIHRTGRFEQADGGTLLLDEIGDLPRPLQAPLLRVLAEGEFYRIGGREPVHVDVRLFAATHQDLEQRIRDGAFRADLLHRLQVLHIDIPPLRARTEDIAPLCQHFLQSAARRLQTEPCFLTPEALAALKRRSWPGNVRQLENFCLRLTAMSPAREIHTDDLLPAESSRVSPNSMGDSMAAKTWEKQLRAWAEQMLAAGARDLALSTQQRLEKLLVETALRHTGGHRGRAAELLGWGRNTLTRKLRQRDPTDRDPVIAPAPAIPFTLRGETND